MLCRMLGEKGYQWSYPALDPACQEINLPGKRPPVTGITVRGKRCSLSGHEACSTDGNATPGTVMLVESPWRRRSQALELSLLFLFY